MNKVMVISLAVLFFITIGVGFASDVNGSDAGEVSLQTDEIAVSEDNSSQPLKMSDESVIKKTVANSEISPSKTIKAKDVSKYYKGSKPYKATFLNSKGKKLANTKVKISVNGKVSYYKTNKYGVVKVSVNLKPGTYKIIAKNPKTGFKLKTTFKILSTIESGKFTKVFKDTKKFRAKFLKANGKALSKKSVSYKFNGNLTTVKTDGKGYITISFDNLKKGKYKLTAYNTDGLKKTFTIKVVKKAKTKLSVSNYVFLKSSKKTLKVRLKDQFDYGLKSGYTVKAKIGGKTFKAKTDSRGVSYIKVNSLKKGIYKVKYVFSGKGYYKSSSITKKIVVIPYKTPKFKVLSTKKFGYQSHNSFIVKLTSGDIPLAKKHVKFKVGGKTYSRTTNSKGIAKIPIDLKIGKYKIKYSVKKDSLINSKVSSTRISVNPRINTSIFWLNDNEFYQGPQTFRVLLKDINDNPLAGKTVSLTVKSTRYSATTSKGGYATFNVITPPGNYNISFSYDGLYDNDFGAVKNTTKINSTYKVLNGYGYWVKKEQFENVNFENLMSLASQGVTDIFLNSNCVSGFGKDRVESWISDVNSLGMKVHFWVQVFKNNDVWSSPIVNGDINKGFYTQKINEIKELSKINGISGIHLDYIRFKNKAYKVSGSTQAISEFIKQSTSAVRSLNKELILSCALVPKMEKSGYYYGQDYSLISQYMDVVIPMIYKGNAGESTGWIKTTTQWYVDNSKGAIVWTGLQTYKSDKDISVLPMNQMKQDAVSAVKGGASGLVLFRWGLTSYIDFNCFAQ